MLISVLSDQNATASRKIAVVSVITGLSEKKDTAGGIVSLSLHDVKQTASIIADMNLFIFPSVRLQI